MTTQRDLRHGGPIGSPINGALLPNRRRTLRDLHHSAAAYQTDGGLFTTWVNYPLANWVAAVAIRFNIHPTVVTLANVTSAVAGSTIVILGSNQLESLWLPGLVGLVLWQLAYTLDCADGLVARVTGKTSSFGARTDVLADFLANASVIAALMTVTARQVDVPVALLVLGGVLWPLSLLVYLLVRLDGNQGHSFTQRQGGVVSLVKLIRDDGFILLVASGWLFVDPATVVVPVAIFCGVELLFLLASIGREAYLSMRVGPDPDGAITAIDS